MSLVGPGRSNAQLAIASTCRPCGVRIYEMTECHVTLYPYIILLYHSSFWMNMTKAHQRDILATDRDVRLEGFAACSGIKV